MVKIFYPTSVIFTPVIPFYPADTRFTWSLVKVSLKYSYGLKLMEKVKGNVKSQCNVNTLHLCHTSKEKVHMLHHPWAKLPPHMREKVIQLTLPSKTNNLAVFLSV